MVCSLNYHRLDIKNSYPRKMSATETPSKQKRRLLSDPSSKPRIEHQRSSSVSSLGTSNSNSSRPSDDQELKSKKARFSTFQIHIEDINAVGAEDDKKTRRKTSRRKSSKKPGPVYCEKKSKSSTAGDSEDEEETDYWEVERIQKYSRDPESGKEKYTLILYFIAIFALLNCSQ